MHDIKEYYDQLAEDYDADRFGNSYGRFIDELEREILSRLLATQPNRASTLEVACGTGRFLEFADVGCDISPEMLSVAKQKYPNKTLLEASCDAIPLPDGSQDCIYAFHLLMHLNESILKRWSTEMHRLLRPNGRWIVDLPTAFRRQFRVKTTGWHGNYAPPLSIFEELGWEIVSVHPLLYIPIHRVPKQYRQHMMGVDRLLSRVAPKSVSSYQIVELAPRMVQ